MTILDIIAEIEGQRSMLGSKYSHLNREETDFVLELLRDQLPVKPDKRKSKNGFDYWFCGKCNALLVPFNVKYCSHCGKKVERDA